MKENKDYLTQQNEDGTESIVEEPQSALGFTYSDYYKWKFKERIELIKGRIFKMCAAPSLKHQHVSGNIEWILRSFLQKSSCKMFHAPVDVLLKGYDYKNKHRTDDQIDTVVQPDIVVVCDEEKLKDNRFIEGAPDLVIEIMSPGNNRVKCKYKLDLYEENGVREYWEVYPAYGQVHVFLLTPNETYGKPVYYEGSDNLCSAVLKGFCVDVSDFFR